MPPLGCKTRPLLPSLPAAVQARHLQQTTATRYYGKNLYECVVNAGLTTTKQMIDVRALPLHAACCQPPCVHSLPASHGMVPTAASRA